MLLFYFDLLLVVGINDMQKFMLLAVKKLCDVLECGVKLGGAQCAQLVCLEETNVSLCLACVACRGLSAAAYAAVGASHDLDEVEELLTLLYLLDELICIAETAYNGNLQSEVACCDFKCFRALKTAHTALGNLSELTEEALQAALAAVSYDGVTGSITFNEEGDANKDMAYIKTMTAGAFKFVGTQKTDGTFTAA